MRKYFSTLLAILLVLISGEEAFSFDGTRDSREYALKAVFLFHCAQFVVWPESNRGGDSFKIGIIGSDPFGSVLDEVVKDEQIDGRPIQITRSNRESELSRCHILFISNSESSRVDSILENLKGKPILTISDSSTFALHGGIIQVGVERNKLSVKVNLSAARKSQLTISSKLLRLAQIVDDNRTEE